MELNLVQIQAVTTSSGDTIIYGLDSQGKLWVKRHYPNNATSNYCTDPDWQKMSMLIKS